MNLVALLLAQTLTIGIGEERQSNFYRTWAPRWDVGLIEIEWGPVVANVAHKRGVAGLNPDRKFPTASVGLQKQVAKTGPWLWSVRTAAYVDFGHISKDERAHWTPAAGLWVRAPIWKAFWLQTAAYLRGRIR